MARGLNWKPSLTTDQFRELHAALDRVRSTSRTVAVEQQALRALLRDHGNLLGALTDLGIRFDHTASREGNTDADA